MKEKNNKMYVLPLILSVLIVLFAGNVMAGTCTFVNPGASATLNGVSNYINITTTAAPITNCTVTAASVLSGGSFTVGTFANNTNVSVNGTFSVAGQRNAADWILTATCRNTTATVDTCTRTALKIDSTVPVVTNCLINGVTAANGTVGSSDATFACTIKNATTCSAYWHGGTGLAFASTAASRSDMSLNAITMTTTYSVTAGATATANIKSISDDNAEVYIACSDGLNTTTGTTYTVSAEGSTKAQKQVAVNLQAGTKAFVPEVQKEQQSKTVIVVIFLLMATLVIIIVAAVYYKSKK